MPIVCLSEINLAVKLTEKNYNNSLFREALKTGFYDLQSARDEYRFSCGSSECMNFYLLLQFMDVQTRLMTPICPHYAEYVWRLPFSEIEVLQENSELIKRQLDLEQVEVLSITDPEAMSKAGHLNLLLNQNLPNPGNPTAIFFSV
ncbi:hypothetical protein SCA6_010617 [Theobroma cacao]